MNQIDPRPVPEEDFDPPGQGSAPAINAPAVVIALFVLMLIVQAFQSFAPRDTVNWLMLHFAFIPARYDAALGFIYPGGGLADAWTFVTHLFLHGDWLHFAINGFFMLAFGSVVARRFGTSRFLLFSLLSGLGAVAAHLWIYWGDQMPLIGASGAISGQMAGTVRLMFARPAPGAPVPRLSPNHVQALTLPQVFTTPRALFFLAVWIGITIIAGVGGVMAAEGSSIAWEAHLGGFAAGMVLFGWLDPGPQEGPGLT